MGIWCVRTFANFSARTFCTCVLVFNCDRAEGMGGTERAGK